MGKGLFFWVSLECVIILTMVKELYWSRSVILAGVTLFPSFLVFFDKR